MKDLQKDIGMRIALLRKNRSITQEALADNLGITIKHISSVERGLASLSLEKLVRTADILDCSMDYLILGSTDPVNLIPHSIVEIYASDNDAEKELLTRYLLLYSQLRNSNKEPGQPQ